MRKCYIINYDLRKTKDYDSLISAIKAYGTWAKPLKSCWLVVTEQTAAQVRDNLLGYMDSDDGILVVRSGKEAAWSAVECSNDWLKEQI